MVESAAHTQDNRCGRLHTSLGKDELLLLRMTCVERLSEPFTIVIDAVSPQPKALHTLLATNISVEIDAKDADHLNRWFNGELWEYVELGSDEHGFRYRLTLRPKTQFMTLNRRNRIFQHKSPTDIVKELLVGDKSASLKGSYDPIEYCVQYQESDFDFCSRLLEYEGIYYFYEHADGAHKIILIDDSNSHSNLDPATVKVLPRQTLREGPYLWSVVERRGVGPAKVSVADYDFEAPATKLLGSKAAEPALGTPTDRSTLGDAGSSDAWASTAEIYEYPSKFDSKSTARGDRYSEAWLAAHRRQMARSFGEGTLFAAAVGTCLTVDFDDTGVTTEYLIVGTTHRYSAPDYTAGRGDAEDFTVELELMPASEQYRPAQRTPRPRIMGPQTAVVVGPSGEEIYTDKYGRIKVQFFWDREGKKDENSSCFIRVVQASAGQNWGSFSLPRIGQEVVVEFLDGDPDRPLVTGAVYNGTNNTPVALPDNKTQFGLRTRITKGGGGHSHYWIEDKKGEEVVWFRAERDYKAYIVNQDEERQYDKGNRKTTFKEGNDELIISKGTRTETIEGDDTKTINSGNLKDTVSKGDETHEVSKGKRTTTIQQDETLEVKMGNRSTKISMGNDSLKVSLGNVDIKVDLGKHSTEALQAIELKCGGSTLKMDPMSISLESMMIKLKGSLMVQVQGLMVESKADAIHIVKGAIVLIN